MIRRRPPATVVSLPSAWVLSRVWALASKPVGRLESFLFDLGLELADGLLDVQVGVPDVQQRLLGEGAHRRPVPPGRTVLARGASSQVCGEATA